MKEQRPAVFDATVRVGRLIEARLDWLNGPDDVAEFQRAMNSAFAKAGQGAIVCADWRGVKILPPGASDALIELLRRGNGRLNRSGVLINAENATFGMQVERLIREANNPARRTFRSDVEMVAWLSELLTPDERQSAIYFLSPRR